MPEDWLQLSRAARDDVLRVLDELPGRADREPVVGAGEGGDDTTAIDAAAERVILDRFRGEDVKLVSEEVGVLGNGRFTVVVDPIDGSLNAKRGIPFFSISIAVADGDSMDDVFFGYVFDFGTGEEWTATRGGGAFLNGAPLTELPKDELEILSFEATTTAYVSENAARFDGVAHRLRIMGSLAITLCHLAAGRVDGVVSLKGARSVDIAAAQLVVRERGLSIELPEAPPFGSAPLDLGRTFTRRRSGKRRAMPPSGRRTSRLSIGCSGWNYPHWRNGVFYPPRCPARRWLHFYAQRFDTVEVNTTFYRLPRSESVGRWVEETPDDFLFSVKVSRYITHVKRLQDVSEHLPLLYERIAPLLASPKLGPLLWQLPPTFACDLGRLAHTLEQVAHDGHRHAFEFRHASWFREDVYDLLREHGAALVLADRPEVHAFQTHELTADFTFVRFHSGTRGRNGNYSHGELDEWAAPARGVVAGGRRLRVFQQRLGGLRRRERSVPEAAPPAVFATLVTCPHVRRFSPLSVV